MSLYYDIGVVVVTVTLLAYFTRLFHQPLIITYILTGIILGPQVLGLVSSSKTISLISELGIIFLLFIVGMQLDLRKMKQVGLASIITGLLEVAIIAGIIYFIASFWFSPLTSLYLGLAGGFCSTIIIVKLLSDKGEIDTLHGRLTLGILLTQDLIVLFLLFFLGFIGKEFNPISFAKNINGLLILIVGAYLFSYFILPPILKRAAKRQEMLLLFAVSWAFLLSYLATVVGLSEIAGAFLAGITLASTEYSLDIIGKIKPLRDFFITLFFVSLGMGVSFKAIGSPWIVAIFAAVIMLVIPTIVSIVLTLFKYSKKTIFLTAVSLTQISEFSLILITFGVQQGHVDKAMVSLVATVAIITTLISTYLITYNVQIYNAIKRFIPIPEKEMEHGEYLPHRKYDAIICGYNRVGKSIHRRLKKKIKKVMVVDYDPDVIKSLKARKKSCLYGDISDEEVMQKLNLKEISLLICAVPDKYDNIKILSRLKKLNSKAIAIGRANDIDDAMEIYEKSNADYVLLPHYAGGEQLSIMLEDDEFNINKFLKRKQEQMKELKLSK